ncbi:sensor histidine kinase [Solimicrobium silvestre]|uniref:histidine kinase n=1 Tax=Solimicrobium silvestre TaxID=2099400 RepID=A0A2S9H121_9BURK|nr:HAMP domain-containing sensor histidine kinase [Solimicrobium silvestre]PRC93657.1 Histidine kinase-, DNA gyrase B-, and HSP90-like ATPase [Solimicrobium silvestre]
MKNTLLEHWRVSTFRLAMLFGVLFIIGNVALLNLIYWQTSSYLVHRIDDSIYTMSANFKNLSPEKVLIQVNDALEYDLRKSNLYGLFSADKKVISGNMDSFPNGLSVDGKIHQFAHRGISPYLPNGAAPADVTNSNIGLARALVQRLPNNDILIIGRDFTQLAEIKAIILNALIGSGAVILFIGLLSGFALSLSPLRRINAIRTTSRRIMQGELSMRMPVSNRHDELDMLATIVNTMLEEIERLLTEVKSVTDTLAHDLRTPLTRLRLMLYRAQQQLPSDNPQHYLLENALTETDALLGRFRALLRISEIENRHRKSGFKSINPSDVLHQLIELFEPLAEDASVTLSLQCDATDNIDADPDLLFEAISNLVDNAIKFTPVGGSVLIQLSQPNDTPRIDIIDTGCGIPIAEREAVLLRFHRSNQPGLHQEKEGYGLGLSIVAAVVRLHGFSLQFQEAETGTHLTVLCTRE